MRLHAENPELSYEEVVELSMRGGARRVAPKDEVRYDFTCWKCGSEYTVNQETHDWIQSLERSPKCGACYL